MYTLSASFGLPDPSKGPRPELSWRDMNFTTIQRRCFGNYVQTPGQQWTQGTGHDLEIWIQEVPLFILL